MSNNSCKSGKIQYPNYTAAYNVAKKMGASGMRAYKCQFCALFHLTHMPQNARHRKPRHTQ